MLRPGGVLNEPERSATRSPRPKGRTRRREDLSAKHFRPMRDPSADRTLFVGFHWWQHHARCRGARGGQGWVQKRLLQPGLTTPRILGRRIQAIAPDHG